MLATARRGAEAGSALPQLQAVATLDEVVVGYLEASLDELPGLGSLLSLQEIYVEPEARGIGAGEALVELAERFALEAGASGIDVAVLPGGREAKNLFESLGYKARLILMHRPMS